MLELKCPLCGSNQFDCVDTDYDGRGTHWDICNCDRCGHTFKIKYVAVSIEPNKDTYLLISKWFAALEDEGVDPWTHKDSVAMAYKYGYTKTDYQNYLNEVC
jgi:hypothetical protein